MIPRFFLKYSFSITLFHISSLIALAIYGYFLFEKNEYQDHIEQVLEGDTRTNDTSVFIQRSMDNRVWIAFLFRTDQIFQDEPIEKIYAFAQDVYRLPQLTGALGLPNILVPKVSNIFNPRFDLLIDRSQGEINWEEIAATAKNTSYIHNILVSSNGKNSLLLTLFDVHLEEKESRQNFIQQLDAIIKKHSSPSFEILKIGLPVLQQEMEDSIFDNLSNKLIFFLILLSVVIGLVCQRLPYVGCMLLSVLSSITLFAIVWFLAGFHLDFYFAMLLLILMTVLLTYMVHFFKTLSYYMGRGEELIDVFQAAYRDVFYPSSLACLTTMIGFFSFGLSELPSIKVFGLMGGLGTLLVFLNCHGPSISCLFLLMMKQKENKTPLAFNGHWLFFLNPLFNRCVFALLIIASISSVLLFKRINTDERAIQYLPESSEMKRALQLLSDEFGGIHLARFEISTKKNNGINDPMFLEKLAKVHEKYERHQEVTAIYSYVQLLSEVNDQFNAILKKEDAKKKIQVPSGLLMNTIQMLLEKFNPQGLDLLIDQDKEKTIMYFRTIDMPSREYIKLVKTIEKDLAEICQLPVVLMGGEHSILKKELQVRDSFTQSFAITSMVCFILLCGVFRSLLLGAAVIFSNMCGSILMLGVLVIYGIQVNMITALAGAIAFGISIDDGIHLIKEYDRSGDLWQTFQKKGPAVLQTSILVCVGLCIFMLLDFPPLRDFGLLSIISICTCLICNLIILPFCLQFVKKKP